MRLGFTFLAVACLLAMSATTLLAAALPNGMDDFESYNAGDKIILYYAYDSADPSAGIAWGGTVATTDTYTVIEADGVDNQVAHIYDGNTGTGATGQAQARTNFYGHTASDAKTTGIWGVSMDIKPLQTDGPFKIMMTGGAGWTSGKYLCAGLGFGSTVSNAFFQNNGGATGNQLLLETKHDPQAWEGTGITYSADTWYTVTFYMDVDNQLYQCWFGERGEDLTQVTSDWTDWMATGNSTTAPVPTTFSGMMISTSNTSGDASELLLDNVDAYVPEPGSIVALVSLLGLIPAMRLKRK